MKFALTQEQPDRPVMTHKDDFETLRQAFRNGDVCLLEVRLKATGERLAAVCAVNWKEEGGAEFVPLAVMPNGNSYEFFDPPNPEGGFKNGT